MPNAHSSRRRFLKVLAQGGALIGTASAGLGCGGTGGTGKLDAGNVKDLPAPTLRALPSASVAIGRDQGGIYAMTLICSHGGCDIASAGMVSTQGLVCACHHSAFDPNGGVIKGPATTPLEHFSVSLGPTGEITVDTDVTVDAATRVAVA